MNEEALKYHQLQLDKDKLAEQKKQRYFNLVGNLAGAALSGGTSVLGSAIGAAGRKASAQIKADSDRNIAGIRYDMEKQYGGNKYGRY